MNKLAGRASVFPGEESTHVVHNYIDLDMEHVFDDVWCISRPHLVPATDDDYNLKQVNHDLLNELLDKVCDDFNDKFDTAKLAPDYSDWFSLIMVGDDIDVKQGYYRKIVTSLFYKHCNSWCLIAP